MPRSFSCEPVGRDLLERLDVEHRDDLVEDRAHPAGRVLDPESRARLHGPLAHPADRRLELTGRDRLVGRIAEHVAARHVDVVREPHDDRLALHGDVERAVVRLDRGDGRPKAGREDDDLVACAPLAACDLTGVAAVVVVLVRHRPDHPLDGEAAVRGVAVARDLDRLQVLEERAAVPPRHAVGRVDDVVAGERGDRDRDLVPHAELVGELAELDLDLAEATLVEVDEVHLVHREDDVRDAERGGR